MDMYNFRLCPCSNRT